MYVGKVVSSVLTRSSVTVAKVAQTADKPLGIL